jgi:hypothetical protein
MVPFDELRLTVGATQRPLEFAVNEDLAAFNQHMWLIPMAGRSGRSMVD